MSYTAKDLAKELGISTSTVSLVLNNKPGISQERRDQVLHLAEARGLVSAERRQQKKNNLGFVVFCRTGMHVRNSPFFSLLLNGASNAASEFGYNLVIIQYDLSLPKFEQIRHIQSSNCDGLIIFATEAIEEDYAEFVSWGIPFVIVDNALFTSRADSICINNNLGVRTAFQYLLKLGHRNIGYLRGKTEINSHAERLSVYRQCMQEHQLPIHDCSIIPLTYLGNNTRAELRPYLESADFPTAFLSDNDFVASSAKESLMALGMQVPKDVSIIGFDNRDFGAIYHPTLTSISMPTDYFGKISIDILMDRIKSSNRPTTLVYLSGTLVERESTAPPSR